MLPGADTSRNARLSAIVKVAQRPAGVALTIRADKALRSKKTSNPQPHDFILAAGPIERKCVGASAKRVLIDKQKLV